jgi:hypothetical protein
MSASSNPRAVMLWLFPAPPSRHRLLVADFLDEEEYRYGYTVCRIVFIWRALGNAVHDQKTVDCEACW